MTHPPKTLIILDLDETLIHGSFAPSETAKLLFAYSRYLKVYERPLARELILLCHEIGDTAVFTTAVRDYANTIIEILNIEPRYTFTREDCKVINDDDFEKSIPVEWYSTYYRIIIIDDSPGVWSKRAMHSCRFIVPKEFFGDKDDQGLKPVIEQLQSLKQ